MENQDNSKHLIVPVLLGFGIFLILAVVIFFTNYSSSYYQKPNKSSQKTTGNTVFVKQKGYFELLSEKTEYKLGEKITIKVIADSNKKTVSGYDLIINYDSKKVKYITNRSLEKTFQNIVRSDKDKLVIMGYKPPTEIKKNIVFEKSAILELDFASIKNDKSSFTIDMKNGATNESNIVDEQSVDLLGEVKNISITIK